MFKSANLRWDKLVYNSALKVLMIHSNNAGMLVHKFSVLVKVDNLWRFFVNKILSVKTLIMPVSG